MREKSGGTTLVKTFPALSHVDVVKKLLELFSFSAFDMLIRYFTVSCRLKYYVRDNE